MKASQKTNWLSIWIFSGAAMLIVIGPITVRQAQALAPRRVICEEWRDYYYNADSGAFIEWIGDPYWVCYPANEPISHPQSPDPDNYGGGWGTPRDPHKKSCEQCKKDRNECHARVVRGGSRCMEHYRLLTHAWCVQHKRKKFGRRLEGDYTCVPIESPDGKPTTDCFGPAITDCEESFAQDQSDRSIENTDKVNIGHDWWGVGSDQTSTTMWGGSRGYIGGCRHAQNEASGVCLANLNTCEEAAGGCR